MDLVFQGDANAVPRSCVTVHEPGARPRKLPLRLELCPHSPTGFGWGYDGAAPAQLALAILAEGTGDDDLWVRLQQELKRELIARLAMTRRLQIDSRQVGESLSAAAAGPAHVPGDAEA